jgi:hypothetical protein
MRPWVQAPVLLHPAKNYYHNSVGHLSDAIQMAKDLDRTKGQKKGDLILWSRTMTLPVVIEIPGSLTFGLWDLSQFPCGSHNFIFRLSSVSGFLGLPACVSWYFSLSVITWANSHPKTSLYIYIPYGFVFVSENQQSTKENAPWLMSNHDTCSSHQSALTLFILTYNRNIISACPLRCVQILWSEHSLQGNCPLLPRQ